MNDKHSVDNSGFFFSPADIDEINKQNSSGSDDWFAGVQTISEGGIGVSEIEAMDLSGKIITDDIRNSDVPEYDDADGSRNGGRDAGRTSGLEVSELARDMEDALKKAAAVSEEPQERILVKPGEKLEDAEPVTEEPAADAEPVTEEPAAEVEPEPAADVPAAEVETEAVDEPAADEPEITVSAKTVIYDRSAVEAALAAEQQADPIQIPDIRPEPAPAPKNAAQLDSYEDVAVRIDAREAAAAASAPKSERGAAAPRSEHSAAKAEKAAAKAEKAAAKAEKAAAKAERRKELKQARTAYKGEGPARRLIAILIGVILVGAAAAVLYLYGTLKPETEYIAGNSNEIEVFTTEDGETLAAAGSVIRGAEVSRYNDTVTVDDEKYYRIEPVSEGSMIAADPGSVSVDDKDDGDDAGNSDAEYYVNAGNLVKEADQVVQEEEVWVRTPATIYTSEDSPAIASFAPKGTHLRVIGFDRLLDNGYINMYKVEYDPVDTKEEDTAEGFVYGKYMAGTQEDAEAVYNEHGETDKARDDKFGFELYGGEAGDLDYYPYEKTAIKGKKFCRNARAMYLNSYAAVHPDAWLKIIEQTDCNAVVLDLKDGPLTFAAETAEELSPTSYKNAYVSAEKLKEGIDKYREAGVYLIGRIVVFNDSYYAKDHPEDCIKYGSDRSWPSAFSRDVWEYNVRLAQEAVEKFGLDEIQFDYVRFPEASYEMSKSGKADFRNKYGEDKAQAVQNFCFYACDQLREAGVYTSVDVFGESAYSYVTAYGQYWAAISNVVDAISAMPYTDHFSGEAPWEHPYDSVLRWAKRAAKQQKRIKKPAAARTWITGYNTPYWDPSVNYNTSRMKDQIKALKDAGLKGGFIPWNALSDLDKYNQYKAIWNK